MARAGRLVLAIHMWPPTLDDNNFFFQTLFLVFLDSMEIPFSQNSSHVLMEDSG